MKVTYFFAILSDSWGRAEPALRDGGSERLGITPPGRRARRDRLAARKPSVDRGAQGLGGAIVVVVVVVVPVDSTLS